VDVDDAREALWAIQRALGPCVLLGLRVVEVEIGQTHRLEVENETSGRHHAGAPAVVDGAGVASGGCLRAAAPPSGPH